MPVSRSTDRAGVVFGNRYRLHASVGAGASAAVYVAEDSVLGRTVAVKVLHDALADDRAFLSRFQAEARAAAALNHPNVMAVYDWGEERVASGPRGPVVLPYLVTEYLGGGSLRALLNTHPQLSLAQAVQIGLEAVRALEYAHRRGLVHRDIKPGNLLFDDDGRLRIADFGLARALAEAAWSEPGTLSGTARYASPEQARGLKLDGRSDVYSLALVLVEVVTGKLPFASDTTIGTLMARIDKPIPVPDELGPLAEIVRAAGHFDPADRATAADVRTALAALAGELPSPEPLPLPGARVTDLDIDPDDETAMLELSSGWQRAIDGAIDLAALDGDGARAATPGPEPVVINPNPSRPTRPARPSVPQWDEDPTETLPIPPGARGDTEVLGLGTVAGAGGPNGAGGTAAPFVPDDEHTTVLPLPGAGDDHTTVLPLAGADDDHTTVLPLVGGDATGVLPPPPNADAKGTLPPPPATPPLRRSRAARDGEPTTAAATATPATPRTRTLASGNQWKIVLVALGLLAGAIAGGSFWWVAMRVPSYPVPSVVGTDVGELEAIIAGRDWSVQRENRFDDQAPAGRILDQDPDPSTEVLEGGSIRVVVSAGPPPVDVPRNLGGQSLGSATEILKSIGLGVGNVERRNDEVIGKDVVMGVADGTPERITKFSTVDLVVSDGPAKRTIPQGLVGKPQADAVKALTDLQLRPQVAEKADDNVAKGTVVSLTPASGAVDRDAVVVVTVSSGPRMVQMPNVLNMTVGEATAYLKGVGLEVGEVDGLPIFPVRATDPAAGTEVRLGTKVKLTTGFF